MPLLILSNAFFVAAEMALARVRRTRIDHLCAKGNKTAKLAQKALDHPDRFISACQLGITLATLGLGALGEQAFAQDMSDYVKDLGMLSQWPNAVTSGTVAFCYVLAFSLTAFLQTVFGELLPKTVTFQRAEPVLLAFMWPMEVWCWFTSPFLKLLNGFTTLVLRVVNVKEPPRHQFVHSEEELKMLVSASHEEGVLEVEEQEMLHSVFDFSDTVASEVMTPRTDMVCVAANSSVRDFVKEALDHGLSRLPVYEDGVDNIFGTVHIRDALRALVEHRENTQVRELVRKIQIVPENKPIGDLLTEFKKTKTHMAIVVDEYGGTRGLVTIEDLIEELVGDIADEHEIVEEYVREQEDGTYLLDAKLPLDEVGEKLGLEIEDEEFNTLGGHVFGQIGREPQVGDEVMGKDYILRVEASDRHRIIKLRLIMVDSCELPAADGGNGAALEPGKNTGEMKAKADNQSASGKHKSLEASK